MEMKKCPLEWLSCFFVNKLLLKFCKKALPPEGPLSTINHHYPRMHLISLKSSKEQITSKFGPTIFYDSSTWVISLALPFIHSFIRLFTHSSTHPFIYLSFSQSFIQQRVTKIWVSMHVGFLWKNGRRAEDPSVYNCPTEYLRILSSFLCSLHTLAFDLSNQRWRGWPPP